MRTHPIIRAAAFAATMVTWDVNLGAAVSDTPAGPFKIVDLALKIHPCSGKPIPPEEWDTGAE